MMKTTIIFLVMFTVWFKPEPIVAGGGGGGSNNQHKSRYQVTMSATTMNRLGRYQSGHTARGDAIVLDEDEWPSIKKCEDTMDKIKEAYDDSSAVDLTLKVRKFIQEVNAMYRDELIRNPDKYYWHMRDSLPEICAVQSLGPGEFGLCFTRFIEYYAKHFSHKVMMANSNERKNMNTNWEK